MMGHYSSHWDLLTLFSYGAAAASICGCSSTSTQNTYLLLRHSIFAGAARLHPLAGDWPPVCLS
ncbi:unnamed protein product [Staurois parvus]|uniref:Secreted protein n=1 Tax=Staurois parvus TaxID=386267 RepID=A0ABN9D466_9NEOB|nr:unnamed protein product [Staurois parvus]